jgi:hypothetical protein
MEQVLWERSSASDMEDVWGGVEREGKRAVSGET